MVHFNISDKKDKIRIHTDSFNLLIAFKITCDILGISDKSSGSTSSMLLKIR